MFSCGDNFIITVLEPSEGPKVCAYGDNTYGQCGLRHGIGGQRMEEFTLIEALNQIYPKMIVCGFKHTLLLDTNNKLWVWGNNMLNVIGYSLGRIIQSPVQIHIESDIEIRYRINV